MKNFLAIVRKNFVFILILIVTISYIIYNNVNINSNESEVANFTIDETAISTYSTNSKPIINSTFDNSFYITTLVDTKLVDYQGKEKWVYSTMFQNPKTAFSGEYLAVWDSKNISNVDVFNQKGFVYEINNTDTILDLDINKNGYVSMLIKESENEGSGYVVKVYNNLGEPIVNRVCDTENTFPVSVSIKDDNRMIALSEIDTNYLQPRSYVTLSYINQEDNKNGESIFSGTTYKNEIIPKIEFCGNYIISYTEDKIHINMIANDVSKEVSTINVNNEIEFAEIIDDKYICLALGSATNSQATNTNVVEFYNFNGSLVSSTPLEYQITNMTPAENSVIIVSNRRITKIKSNGNIEFTYVYNKDFYNAYYIGNKKQFIVLEGEQISSVSE